MPKAVHSMAIGNTKIAWYANKDSPYKSIASQVGVKINDTAKDLIFGAIRPRGVKVRFNLEGGKSVVLTCHPDKANAVVNQNNCKGKTIKGKKIMSAGFLRR
jgi:hypothetical protein